MSDKHDDDKRIERELRATRHLDPTRIIMGRDGGHLKGASPTPVIRQALLTVSAWLDQHLDDSEQALTTVIIRRLEAYPALLEEHRERPDVIVATWVASVLGSEAALQELVREVDMAWGQANQERPHFQIGHGKAHPDDPYTIASVREQLNGLRTERS